MKGYCLKLGRAGLLQKLNNLFREDSLLSILTSDFSPLDEDWFIDVSYVTSYWDLSILDLTYHNLSQFSTQVSISDSAVRLVSQKVNRLVYKEERRTENQLIKTTTLSKTSVHKSGKTTNPVQQIPNGVYSNQTRTQVLE